MRQSGSPFMPDLALIETVSVAEISHATNSTITGDEDVAVRGAVADNRRVRGGELFIALPGEHVHGASFAESAISAGAAAVLTDSQGASILGDISVPLLVCENVTESSGVASALAWGSPGEKLRLWGVTGTNGKTTVAYLIKAILEGLGFATGLIGTIEVAVGSCCSAARNTTPLPDELQAVLASAVQQGVTDVVMEVSSHGLALGRVSPMRFNMAGFTNLSQDHLDFHHTMEEYFQAKKRLFGHELSAHQVVLKDDSWGVRLAEELSGSQTLTTLSLSGEDADISATFSQDIAGVHLEFSGKITGGLDVNLIGDYNAANVALALTMVSSQLAAEGDEVRAKQICAELGGSLQVRVPGRMEQLSDGPRVIVDFAHNPEATRKLLETLRPTTRGDLIIVVGSAGQRDREKRPILGALVCELADKVYITDDDPHEEDPAQIRADMLAGMSSAKDGQVIEIADRTEAIFAAIKCAKPEDTIVLAGRGHETVQPTATGNVELDDRVLAHEALLNRKTRSTDS